MSRATTGTVGETAGPTTGRPALVARVVAAPLVLLLVAGLHVFLRYSADLTPWKGGGFGMFSTIDSPGTRLLRVQVRSELGTTPVAVPPRLSDIAAEARAAPSEERLARLAEELAGELWVVPRLVDGASSSPQDEALSGVALETLAEVAPADTVRAVDPGSFDDRLQQPIRIDAVEVAVLRLTAEAEGDDESGETLRPTVVRSVVASGAARGSGRQP